MKAAHLACLLLLIATALFAQSNPSPELNKAQAPSSFSRLSQGLPIAQTARLAAARRKAHPPVSGLNFATAVPYSAGPYRTYSVVLADVNGDGASDMLVATGGGVGVLLGNGDGTFQDVVTYGSGGYLGANSVAVADVNGDGKADLLVASECANSSSANGLVGVLLGNGDGTFQAAVTYDAGGLYTYSVAVADLNGDGKPDVAVTNYCDTIDCSGNGTGNGSVDVLLGNGDGTFQTAVNYGTGMYGADSVAIADVNGDGKLDLLVANYCVAFTMDECESYGSVGVLLGNGDGTFQTAMTYNSGGIGAQSVAVADVNGDGKLDLVIANLLDPAYPYGIGVAAVLLGSGDGTFPTAVTYVLDGPPQSAVLADVNGDGKLDIVDAEDDGFVGVLLGNGDGTFQAEVGYGAGGTYEYSLAVADVNGDSKPDLVVANYVSTVGVLINISIFPTTTALVSSPNPSNYVQTVTFTATVTPQYEFGKTTPTGTVSFFDGATNLGSSSLNSAGVATLSTSTLAIGTHSITASYGGDSNFASSTSQVLSQVVQGAIAQITPTSINFGNQTVGIASSSKSVTLTNTGNVALTISNIAVVVSNGGYLFNSTCAASLAVGASCTVSVSWTPVTSGSMTGSLTFTDSASNSPQIVSLSGVGVAPAVTLSPSSLTFPTQIVFTSSKTQTVTLTNTGVGTLSITNKAITGPFTQTNNCGTTINAGGACTFTVTFKPTKSGAATGSLSITDNALLSPQTVSLKGTGNDMQFNPVSFNFGNQPVGTKSLPKKITLSNKASVAVNLTKISLTGAEAADFSETNTCGTKLAGGASCFITVTFTPSVRGTRTAEISVTDNGGGSPQTAGLSGTGT